MRLCTRLCARATVTSGGRHRVNPTLRLNIKLSDQGINNSDGSLSGSIGEPRLRGRRRHNTGAAVMKAMHVTGKHANEGARWRYSGTTWSSRSGVRVPALRFCSTDPPLCVGSTSESLNAPPGNVVGSDSLANQKSRATAAWGRELVGGKRN